VVAIIFTESTRSLGSFAEDVLAAPLAAPDARPPDVPDAPVLPDVPDDVPLAPAVPDVPDAPDEPETPEDPDEDADDSSVPVTSTLWPTCVDTSDSLVASRRYLLALGIDDDADEPDEPDVLDAPDAPDVPEDPELIVAFART